MIRLFATKQAPGNEQSRRFRISHHNRWDKHRGCHLLLSRTRTSQTLGQKVLAGQWNRPWSQRPIRTMHTDGEVVELTSEQSEVIWGIWSGKLTSPRADFLCKRPSLSKWNPAPVWSHTLQTIFKQLAQRFLAERDSKDNFGQILIPIAVVLNWLFSRNEAIIDAFLVRGNLRGRERWFVQRSSYVCRAPQWWWQFVAFFSLHFLVLVPRMRLTTIFRVFGLFGLFKHNANKLSRWERKGPEVECLLNANNVCETGSHVSPRLGFLTAAMWPQGIQDLCQQEAGGPVLALLFLKAERPKWTETKKSTQGGGIPSLHGKGWNLWKRSQRWNHWQKGWRTVDETLVRRNPWWWWQRGRPWDLFKFKCQTLQTNSQFCPSLCSHHVFFISWRRTVRFLNSGTAHLQNHDRRFFSLFAKLFFGCRSAVGKKEHQYSHFAFEVSRKGQECHLSGLSRTGNCSFQWEFCLILTFCAIRFSVQLHPDQVWVFQVPCLNARCHGWVTENNHHLPKIALILTKTEKQMKKGRHRENLFATENNGWQKLNSE